MAPIERKPLPPPNADVTTLAEGDRAEFLARADEVINHYLSGPGSYWDEGPRKPLEETLSDLSGFRSQVDASKQLADDPGRILDTVAELVEGAIGRVKQAVKYRDGSDDMRVPLPETNDRIIRVPRGLPAGRPEKPGIALRFLSGKTMDRMPAPALDARTASQSEMPQGAPLLGLVRAANRCLSIRSSRRSGIFQGVLRRTRTRTIGSRASCKASALGDFIAVTL